MSLPKKHVFICIANRPPVAGASCGAVGSRELMESLQFALMEKGAPLTSEVQVTGCGCLGPCEKGANMVIYPDGVWYQKVTPADVGEIVDAHLVGGKPVERLLYHGED